MAPKQPRYFRQHSSFIQGPTALRWVAASGVEGLSSVTVVVNPSAKSERSYTIRLHFANRTNFALDNAFSMSSSRDRLC